MWPPENSYGVSKRLEFIGQIIRELRPGRVLDYGCGAGTFVTSPLAQEFPQIKFVGVDSDGPSIAFARRGNTLPNLAFWEPDGIGPDDRFDLIIASEIIEHVEDPEAFLLFLRTKLADRGRMVLTLPNGYGPFEIVGLLQAVLKWLRLYRLLHATKRHLSGRAAKVPAAVDTLAASPHINFFLTGRFSA